MTSLKDIFRQSREQRNVDLVLPVFNMATLYLVVASEPKVGHKPEFFLTKSPTEGRFCVTVSESEEALARVPWPKIRLSGEQLLRELPTGIEVVIVYHDGGDYLNREQLAWYSQFK